MQFYNVGGLLVRRWIPARRRLAMEAWNGERWAPYASVDEVLRHGQRLSDADALGLLGETRRRTGTLAPLSAEEAQIALAARLRRARG